MTDLVVARRATQDDLEATAAIAQAAELVARNERGGRWLLDHDRHTLSAPLERHRGAAAAPDACVVVGTIEGAVVGFAVALLSPTIDGQLCMIDELVVHPEARAVGVGSAVLEEVREWAIDNQCQAIESQVLPGNRAAKNFFERVGMKTRKMRVSADLESDSSDS